MNYKIDIFTLKEKFLHSSEEEYFGSILFESNQKSEEISDFIHHAGGKMAIEGIEIISYNFNNYTIIKLTDYFRDGDFFCGLIKNNYKYKITNETITDNLFKDNSDFLLVRGESASEIIIEDVLSYIDDNSGSVVKSDYLFEWGATGIFENYLIGIASSLTVLVIDKLMSIGLRKDDIKIFKIPDIVKSALAKEYNII